MNKITFSLTGTLVLLACFLAGIRVETYHDCHSNVVLENRISDPSAFVMRDR